MAENQSGLRSSDSEQRQGMPVIQWPERPKMTYGEPELSERVNWRERLRSKKSSKQVELFYNSVLSLAASSLDVPLIRWDDVTVQDRPGAKASFSPEMSYKEGPGLLVSKKIVDEIRSSLRDYLTGNISLHDSIKEDDFQKLLGQLIADSVASIAHEMYHYRQHQHDPKFYDETRDENMSSRFLSNIAAANRSEENLKAAQDIYHYSQGERGANGYMIRFLVELRQQLLAKEDERRSHIEKFFLVGVDDVIRLEVDYIREKFSTPRHEGSDDVELDMLSFLS